MEHIGERENTLENIAVEQELWEAGVRNAIEMIFFLDREGRILACNRTAQEELGYGGHELTGMCADSIFMFSPEDNPETVFLNIQEKKEITGMMAYRKNGTCFPVFLKMIPDEKKESGVLLLGMNETVPKAMEKELLHLKSQEESIRKLRSEFIANVTHELRTPIHGVRGHTSALLAEHPAPDQKKALEIILRCCDDMNSIIDNILDFSKLEAGKFELSMTRFDLYEMMDHVIATNIAVIKEKGLHVSLNISDNVPRYVMGDDLRLIQILNNLISNAVKFTDIGFISVDVDKHMQYGNEIDLFFVVRDSGIGISQEDTDRLFHSFSQVDASATRKYGGTGLGLVITKELVELMGGSIRVESQKDKGSNFSFSIRVKATEAQGSQSYVSPFLDKGIGIVKSEEAQESFYRFGSEENAGEIKRKTEKLILALELGAWEKAEMIAASLKKLIEDGPADVSKMLFRLQMAMRKEDEVRSLECFETLKQRLQEEIGGM